MIFNILCEKFKRMNELSINGQVFSSNVSIMMRLNDSDFQSRSNERILFINSFAVNE